MNTDILKAIKDLRETVKPPKSKRLPDRQVYPSTYPLRSVKAVKADTGEETTTYEYDTTRGPVGPLDKFARKVKSRPMKYLVSKRERLAREHRKLHQTLIGEVLEKRAALIKIYLDAVESQQQIVETEIKRRANVERLKT